MSPEEMYAARRVLGLTQTEMAHVLGYQGSQMRQMQDDLETGKKPIREPQRRLVEAYLAGYRPPDWPRKVVSDLEAIEDLDL